MKVKCESSYSRDFVPTKFGKFFHTNGHWWIKGSKIEGWYRELPEAILRVVYAGSPSCCSVIELDVPAFESWIDGKIAEGHVFEL